MRTRTRTLTLAILAITSLAGCEQKAEEPENKTAENTAEPAGDEPTADEPTADEPTAETAGDETTDETDEGTDDAPAAGGSTSTVETDGGPVIVHVLQHGTFALVWDGKTILVDPVADAFANAPNAKSVPPADLVLVTDIHGDHLDAEQIANSRADSAPVVAPQAVVDQAPTIENPTVIANGESTDVLEGFTITAVPMYNTQRKRPDSGEFFHVKGRGNGYLVEHGDTRVYISGDTECTDEMKALTDIDIAFVTMNLPYTMPIDEAAGCVRAFKPTVIFPFHHRGQDPDAFAGLLEDTPETEVRVLDWYPASDNPTGESPQE